MVAVRQVVSSGFRRRRSLKTCLSIADRDRPSEQARPRGATSAHSGCCVSEEKRSGRAAQPAGRRERLIDTSSGRDGDVDVLVGGLAAFGQLSAMKVGEDLD